MKSSAATFVDCHFEGNKTTDFGFFGGGAIHGGDILGVNNCTFINNSSVGRGGAVEVLGSASVIDSNFTGNAAVYGGAISNWTNDGSFPSRLLVSNSTFTSNSAQFGGALGWDSSIEQRSLRNVSVQ